MPQARHTAGTPAGGRWKPNEQPEPDALGLAQPRYDKAVATAAILKHLADVRDPDNPGGLTEAQRGRLYDYTKGYSYQPDSSIMEMIEGDSEDSDTMLDTVLPCLEAWDAALSALGPSFPQRCDVEFGSEGEVAIVVAVDLPNFEGKFRSSRHWYDVLAVDDELPQDDQIVASFHKLMEETENVSRFVEAMRDSGTL